MLFFRFLLKRVCELYLWKCSSCRVSKCTCIQLNFNGCHFKTVCLKKAHSAKIGQNRVHLEVVLNPWVEMLRRGEPNMKSLLNHSDLFRPPTNLVGWQELQILNVCVFFMIKFLANERLWAVLMLRLYRARRKWTCRDQ